MALEAISTAEAPEPFGPYAQATAMPDGTVRVAGPHHGFRVAADAVTWRIHGR